MDLRGVSDGLAAGPAAVSGSLRRAAGWVAERERLPTEARAALGHYAGGGRLDVGALRLQPLAEDRVEAMVETAFDEVAAAVAEACGVEPAAVRFEYGTKLLLPVELTLARLYRDLRRRADDGFDPVERTVTPGVGGRLLGLVGGDETGDGADVDPAFSTLVRETERVERLTRLVVVALLDGDMRDAVNDEEYGDFVVSIDGVTVTDGDGRHGAGTDGAAIARSRVAEIAQSTLRADVERRFERFPDGVRTAYERAVAASEAHQERDPEFRELLAAAEAGDPGGRRAVRERYRDATFESAPGGYDDADLGLPYFRTQYGRVGVIYDGMFDMYGAAGVEVDAAFRRAVVLTTVYAQVWLDDVDDYAADAREGQLTPVTAEYVLADGDREGYRRVREVADRYAERARTCAARSRSPLVGIAVEYVTRSGDPTVLPGRESSE